MVPALSVVEPPPNATELSRAAVAPEPIATAFTLLAVANVPILTLSSAAVAFIPTATAASEACVGVQRGDKIFFPVKSVKASFIVAFLD